jgi:sodium/bile acid cotransporter 7
MREDGMVKRRYKAKGFVLMVALAFLSTVLLRTAVANEELSEEEKRLRVDALYQDYKKAFPEVPEMKAEETLELSAQEKFILVDIREPEEQSVSALPSAITAEEFLRNPGAYKDHLIIGYCTNGYRSGVLAKELQEKDIRMFNLAGGVLAWLHAGGEIHKDGEPVKRVHVYGRQWDLAPSGYETMW